MGSSFALGPVLGGLLVDGAGWRSLFLINVPLCLLIAGVVTRSAPPTSPNPEHRVDVAGQSCISAFFALGLGALVLWQGRLGGAAVPTLCGVAALIALAGFLAIDGRRPGLLDPRMFRHRPTVAITVFPVAFSVAFWALLIMLPRYYQDTLDMPPALSLIHI